MCPPRIPCLLGPYTPCCILLPSHTGAVADALNLNAGVALAAAQVVATPADGVALAQEVQRSGKAAATLQAWQAASHRLGLAEAEAAKAGAGAAAGANSFWG